MSTLRVVAAICQHASSYNKSYACSTVMPTAEGLQPPTSLARYGRCQLGLLGLAAARCWPGLWMDNDVVFYQDLTHLLSTSYQFVMRWWVPHGLALGVGNQHGMCESAWLLCSKKPCGWTAAVTIHLGVHCQTGIGQSQQACGPAGVLTRHASRVRLLRPALSPCVCLQHEPAHNAHGEGQQAHAASPATGYHDATQPPGL